MMLEDLRVITDTIINSKKKRKLTKENDRCVQHTNLWYMYSKTTMNSWALHANKYSEVDTRPSWSPEKFTITSPRECIKNQIVLPEEVVNKPKTSLWTTVKYQSLTLDHHMGIIHPYKVRNIVYDHSRI